MKTQELSPALRAAVRLLRNGWEVRVHFGLPGSPDNRYFWRTQRRAGRKPKTLCKAVNPSTFNALLARRMITTQKVLRKFGLVCGRIYRPTHLTLYGVARHSY